MKKNKKIIVIVIMAIAILLGKNVYAKEVYYTNSNGVEFTKDEYDFFTYLMRDGYQEFVTQEMVDEIAGKTIYDEDVKSVNICPTNVNKLTHNRDNNLEVTTDAKSLLLGKYCTPFYCRAVIDLSWLAEPYVKSYDVVGSLLDGPTRLTEPITLVSSTTTGASHVAAVYETDGFGTVVQLPTTGDNIHIAQNYIYSGTGVIYYTYQHSMFTISLANSQLFHIDLVGYGNVLNFYGAAVGYYDDMPGVYMEV